MRLLLPVAAPSGTGSAAQVSRAAARQEDIHV